MQSRGVFRRIDELGRVVIPKDYRESLKLNEGDKVEFIIENDRLIISKISSYEGLDLEIFSILEALERKLKHPLLLTDNEKVLFCYGDDVYLDKPLSEHVLIKLKKRVKYDGYVLKINDEIKYQNEIYLLPIIVKGDLRGSLIVLENKKYLTDNEKDMLDLVIEFIIKKFER